MRHLFNLLVVLVTSLVLTGCQDWFSAEGDPSNNWPESTATNAELTSLAGIYTCPISSMGAADVVMMEECFGQFQGTGAFSFSVAAKNVGEFKIGGYGGLTDGAFYDNTWEEWYCPGYEIMGDLSACGGAYDGLMDFELTVYEDEFAGHDVWTDGVADNNYILHGWLVHSGRPVVIEANGNTGEWEVYLRDDSGDNYHDLYFFDLPGDFDWPDVLQCYRVSTDVYADWVALENCSFDSLSGTSGWEYILN